MAIWADLPARTRGARGSRWRTGKPIGNHRDQFAVGAKAFARRGSLVNRLPQFVIWSF